MQRNHPGVLLLALSMAMLLTACGQKTMYEWGGYNRSLLSYYKNPGAIDEFAEDLSETLQEAEAVNGVPPGLYAEYGYIMLELGDADTAIEYFNKERNRWPESAYLMDKVISRLSDSSSGSGL